MTRRELVAGCIPQALVAMDFAVLTVAVPSVRASLDVGAHTAPWIFSAFNLTFGALLLPAGHAADRLGPRRVLCGGLACCAAGSTAVAVAPSLPLLLGARVVEATGAATMSPAALALLAGTAAGPERDRGLQAYGLSISAGFVAGALTSGLLVPLAGWRAGILVVPALALVGLGAALRTPRHAPGRAVASSWVSLALAPAVLAVALALSAGVLAGLTVALAVAAALASCRNVRRGASRAALSAWAAGAAVTGTGVAATLVLSTYLQDDRGYGPLHAGLVLATFGLAAPGAGAAARLLLARAVPPLQALTGLAAQGGALGLLAVAFASSSALPLLAGVVAFGCGHVLGNVAAAALAMRTDSRPGSAAGSLATAQYFGGAVGPALLVGGGGQPAMLAAAATVTAAALALPLLSAR